MNKKLISFVVPAYREEKNISLFYDEFKKNFANLEKKYDYELIFVNDGSPDKTWEEILKICEIDENVKGINLSRNFGHQAALTAGYTNALGDAIISMDADWQDPISLIEKMLQEWEDGFEIVYARRTNRNDNWLKKYTALLYYRLLANISETQIPRNVGDFRLISQKVLKTFLQLPEKDRYIRGIFAWLGYSYSFVDFDRPERIHGQTGYTWKKMWKLATDGILNFSTFPLKIGLILGIIMMFLSFGFFVYVTIDFFVRDTYYPLYKWLTIGMFGFMGLQFIFMWILGEYIGRIYNETRNRPIFIISEKININKNPHENISKSVGFDAEL